MATMTLSPFYNLLGGGQETLPYFSQQFQAASTLPDWPMVRIVHLITLHRICIGISGYSLLMAYGVLVDRSIGLGGCIVRGWDAVAGLTAVVTVPVIHGAVRVIICKKGPNIMI